MHLLAPVCGQYRTVKFEVLPANSIDPVVFQVNERMGKQWKGRGASRALMYFNAFSRLPNR
ncbi:MAG: hypothetical protein DSY90_12555 [Deltaproteobacteria bacterium]|nr:MAG: hypothetical protein DSY90_12555 [Deltaproteobacteria bacterium]